MFRLWLAAFCLFVLSPLVAARARAGVVNPDLSVIGQPFIRWTDDPADSGRKRLTLDVGETEFVYDAYLNPYARGLFIASLAAGGIELEEGTFTLTRGLPAGLSLKGGKYRAGFGRLNPQHPHVYPFARRFRVLASYLPGAEALNETGLQLSEVVPLTGDVPLTASVDWLQGDTYRIARAPSGSSTDPLLADPTNGDHGLEPRPAMLGRLSTFVPVNDRSGIDLGLSATQGTNNVAAGTRTTVVGGDIKAKLWNSPNSYVVVQGEVLRLDRENAGWNDVAATYTKSHVRPLGGYVYADYNFALRYNAGGSFERWQQPTADTPWNHAVGVFAGFALLEETTAFRIDWNHMQAARPAGAAADPPTVNVVTLRVVYSMGPHKAHQF